MQIEKGVHIAEVTAFEMCIVRNIIQKSISINV